MYKDPYVAESWYKFKSLLGTWYIVPLSKFLNQRWTFVISFKSVFRLPAAFRQVFGTWYLVLSTLYIVQ